MRIARQQSWLFVASAGLPTNEHLPVIEGRLRPVSVLVERALCLNVLAAVSYGFAVADAKKWLEKESLLFALSPKERAFVGGNTSDPNWIRAYPEALFALAWLLGVYHSLSPESQCPQNLVTLFPNLKGGIDSHSFRERVRAVSEQQALEMLDLFYCTHWATRETGAYERFPGLELRRYALEWSLTTGGWDDVSLDT
jgi:elongation factor P hydroxylase